MGHPALIDSALEEKNGELCDTQKNQRWYSTSAYGPLNAIAELYSTCGNMEVLVW